MERPKKPIEAEVSREQVISSLAFTARRGCLGLFVGTGFSIAATEGKAHTFEKLLLAIARKFGVTPDFRQLGYELKSLPQIASKLVAEYQEVLQDKADALEEMRLKISELCNYLPAASVREKFKTALQAASPSWVITTNYDLIVESLMSNSESILPSQPLYPNTARVPIFHLHGHRHYPSSICITEEDYVSRLAPLDYQRLKLPLLFFESTTLFLGYGLGDINVRAALEWSKSFHPALPNRSQVDKSMIQVVYSLSPKPEPYVGPNGQLIVEVSDIADLLSEIGIGKTGIEEKEKHTVSAAKDFLADPNSSGGVIDKPDLRIQFLAIIDGALFYTLSAEIADFLQRTIRPIWKQARGDGGFAYYNQYLEFILDILDRIDHVKTSPLIVSYIAQSLERVGRYIDPAKPKGSAFDATNTWLARSPKLKKEMIAELRMFAASNSFNELTRILDFIPTYAVATKPATTSIE